MILRTRGIWSRGNLYRSIKGGKNLPVSCAALMCGNPELRRVAKDAEKEVCGRCPCVIAQLDRSGVSFVSKLEV